MKNPLYVAMSMMSKNALTAGVRLTLSLASVAGVAVVAGTTVAARKTSDWANKAADKSDQVAMSMAVNMMAKIPVAPVVTE